MEKYSVKFIFFKKANVEENEEIEICFDSRKEAESYFNVYIYQFAIRGNIANIINAKFDYIKIGLCKNHRIFKFIDPIPLRELIDEE